MTDSTDAATQTFIRNLEAKTGKTVDQWVALARKAGGKHGQIVKHLKTEHGLTHGYANFVALRALAPEEAPSEDDLLEAQYAGAKAGLRPIHDTLVSALSRFGSDVEFAPKKAYVSIRRSKQFACIQPSTATRLDLGINLKGVKPAGRLEASGSFNSMFSHRVRLSGADQVDDEVLGWLRQAYDQA